MDNRSRNYTARPYAPNGRSPNGNNPSGRSPSGNNPNGRSPNGYSPSGQSRAEAERKARLAREREKIRKRQRFIVRLFLTSTIMMIVFAVTVFVWWKAFSSAPDADSRISVIYRYGGEANTEIVSHEKAFRSGVLYVNFTKTADFLGMSSVGSAEKVKYIVRSKPDGTGNDEYVVFTANSDTANVNGRSIRIEAAAFTRGDSMWVPASFVREHMSGASLNYTANDGIALVTRTVAPESTKENIIYNALSFAEKPTTAPAMVSEDEATDSPVFKPTFVADLSAYEQYMDPSDRTEYLVLANKTTMLDASFVPPDLTDIADTRKDGRETQQMRYTAAKALEALFIEMRAEGMADYNAASGQSVSVMSGYRSYSYQKYLFDYYVSSEKEANPSYTDEQAKAIVLTYSAFPGTSEHQTGLCVDMHNLPSADESYKSQASYAWLRENAWKFGFILRYPEDKVEITGYSFEPWHWRFVGRDAAYTIWQNGLCLEEYLANLDR